MPNIRRILEDRATAAIASAYPEAAGAPAIVQASADPRFGDYQANGAMALAKRLKLKPRDVAGRVVEHLKADAAVAAMVETGGEAKGIEIAGPGFINFRLDPDWIAERLGEINRVQAEGKGGPGAQDSPGGQGDRGGGGGLDDRDRLGVEPAAEPETVVVDYSAPNLAKEMHVGHLRSTIIGDALVRMLQFAGHDVVRQNHVGDWGTQFGVVILGMWHLCMSEERGEPDYVEAKLGELADVSPSDPVRARIAALRAICEQHQVDFEKDVANRRFKQWVANLANREISFDLLLSAYRFVTRVEEVAEGTEQDLFIADPRDDTITPLSRVSRRVTAYLQNATERKNKEEWDAWRYAMERTLQNCDQLYGEEFLNVTLTRRDVRGESLYDARSVGPDAPEARRDKPYWDVSSVIEALKENGLLTESEGALCVFLEGFTGKDGKPRPLIVRKSDPEDKGLVVYLYATTDLAAIRYRVGEIKAVRILYVVDARQSDHFQMVFAVARKAGFTPEGVGLFHVAFGTILGEDNRPFKTREGEVVKLRELLEEAKSRARDLIDQKQADLARRDANAPDDQPRLSDDERRDIARKVGIGAVKYADLSQNRTSDYVFSWDKMLSLQGNTAPYMQYAYARVRSIFRKGEHDEAETRRDASPIPVPEPAEAALGKAILQFPETLDRALADYRPNILAAYLYDLAQAFTAFYDACPVLKSDEPVRTHRLKLCDLTARVMQRGLALLGIETAERM